uniref:Reverse transcriptase domain-containing protein n=1 Tax=Angiostrongylus cantonensis TaxID=6313 RepID=A0A158P798_ANGCA
MGLNDRPIVDDTNDISGMAFLVEQPRQADKCQKLGVLMLFSGSENIEDFVCSLFQIALSLLKMSFHPPVRPEVKPKPPKKWYEDLLEKDEILLYFTAILGVLLPAVVYVVYHKIHSIYMSYAKLFAIRLLFRRLPRIPRSLEYFRISELYRKAMEKIIHEYYTDLFDIVRPFFLTFIDLEKAFDSIEIEAVTEALGSQGVPTQYIKILREMYKNFTTKISPFYNDINVAVKRGDRQGDTFSLKLFTATLQNVMRTLEWDNMGVKIDGRQIHHLRFADDIVLITPDFSQAERMLADFGKACGKIGVRLNLRKTMFIKNGLVLFAPLTLNGTNISECFSYKKESERLADEAARSDVAVISLCTENGPAQRFLAHLQSTLSAELINPPKLWPVENLRTKDIIHFKGFCVFVVETLAAGAAPTSAEWFLDWLEDVAADAKQKRKANFDELKFAIVGFGSSTVEEPHFNKTSHTLLKRMKILGSKQIMNVVLFDTSQPESNLSERYDSVSVDLLQAIDRNLPGAQNSGTDSLTDDCSDESEDEQQEMTIHDKKTL